MYIHIMPFYVMYLMSKSDSIVPLSKMFITVLFRVVKNIK